MPGPAAAAATTTDARQRPEVNRSRRPAARLDLSRDARGIRGGSGRGCWLVVSSRPRRVLCRIPNAIVQSKCWAARSIMLGGANPGLALRCGGISGIINPVSHTFLREVASRMLFSVATGWVPLSPDLLVEGKASRPAFSQLATTHRRDQATIAGHPTAAHLRSFIL